MPMDRRHSPPWEWVQRRLPGTEKLILQIDCRCDGQKNVLTVEPELITAHLLLVLSSAQTCKLREFTVMPVRYLRKFPELNGQVSKAISRFNLLTLLSLRGLEVKADTRSVPNALWAYERPISQ